MDGKPGSSWLKQHIALGRRTALPAILMTLAAVPLAILQAWIIAALLGAVLLGHRAADVTTSVLIFAGCAVARAGLGVLAERAAAAAGARGRHHLRHQILQRLLDAGPGRLRGHHTGELVSLVVDQVESLEGLFARWIPAEFLALAAPLVVAGVVLFSSPFAGVVLIVAGLLMPVAMAASGIGAAAASRRQFVALTRLQTRFLDRVRGIATIVLAGRAEAEAEALGLAAAELRRRTMRVLRVAFLSSSALDCAMAAALVILALHDAGALLSGRAAHPARDLFALLLVPEFFAPLRAYSAAYQDRFQARTTGEALAQLPEAEAVSLPAQPVRTIEAHGVSIAFEDVTLTWDPARGPALDGVTFRVAAGETLVVAGPSGAGKSSLIELLLGFARPDSGSITLNGMRLETIVPAALARMTAWIGQRPLLFAGTLRENIRFGRPEASDAEVEEAAARARVAVVADALPQGLDTPLGEAGHGLSGGQAQRVAIARAFLRNAPLLLLDEPTAHLDPATEAEVLESLKRLAIGRTVILVTHSAAAQSFPGRRIDLRHGRLLGTIARGAAPLAFFKAGPLAMTPEPSARDLLTIYRLWSRQWFWLALGLLVSLAAVGSFVALLSQSGRTIAAALIAGVLAAPVLLRVLGLARVVLRYLERLLTHEATFRALADLRVWFFRGLSLRAAGGLGFRRAGDVLSRLVNDVGALDGLYLRITVPAAAAVLLLIVLPVLIWPHGAVLAILVTMLFAAAALAVPALAARDAMGAAGGLAQATAALRIAALDLLGGLREARAFGAEDRLLAGLQSCEVAHQAALDGLSERGARAQAAAFLCAQAALLVVLIAAAIRGRADPVSMVAVVFLVVAAFEAVALLPRAGALAGHAAASAHRVLAAASGPIADPPPAHPAALPIGTSLRFEQVRFAWSAERAPVFDGLNLEIPRGARVAVLGPSGSGKSSLAALALRVVLPQAGRVALGGIDTAQLRPEDVRSRFSWLSQATHLFDDTIRANLLLGRPDADETALWTALDAAHIGDLVRSLPSQLDSWVGEAGNLFSGGQGRRLALARALLSTAPILILDEPCAGLDAQTEQEFLTTLNEVAAGRSVLLIAHRLTGVEKLDRIYRLSAGHAVAAAG